MKHRTMNICFAQTLFACAIVVPVLVSHGFVFDRYVRNDNATFLLSEIEELTCSCSPGIIPADTKNTYYRKHVDSLETLFLRKDKTAKACGGNLVFHHDDPKFVSKSFKSNVTCITFRSTAHKFTAIELAFNRTSYIGFKDISGYFDFDDARNISTTPCWEPEPNRTCLKDVAVYNVGVMACCQPGVPFNENNGGNRLLSDGISAVFGLTALITVWKAF